MTTDDTSATRRCAFDWPNNYPNGSRRACDWRVVGDRDGKPACEFHIQPAGVEFRRADDPRDGPPYHEPIADCWCEPQRSYVDPLTGRTLWVHREVQ